MGFEVLNSHLGSIASMATRRYQVHFHLVLVADDIFHRFGHFVIEDVLLRHDTGKFETQHERSICPCELCIFTTAQRLDKNGIAIDLNHNHEILVAFLGPCRKLTSLVGKNGFTHIIHSRENIALLLATQCSSVREFQWHGLWLGGPHIFSGLVHVAFRRLNSFGIVL